MPQSVTNCNGFEYPKWTVHKSPVSSSRILSPVSTKNGRPITGLPCAPEGGMKYKELEKAIFY